MRITNSLAVKVGATILSLIPVVGRTEDKKPDKIPQNIPIAVNELDMNRVPATLLVQNAAKPDEPKPNYLITERHRILARENKNSFFAYELMQNPACSITEKDLEIALSDLDSWFAYGVAKNSALLPEGFKKLEEIALKNPAKKLALGVFQNKNFKVTQELKEKVRKCAEQNTGDYSNHYSMIVAMHPSWRVEEIDRKLSVKGNNDGFKYWVSQNPTSLMVCQKENKKNTKRLQDAI